jgi:hypothetical protein
MVLFELEMARLRSLVWLLSERLTRENKAEFGLRASDKASNSGVGSKLKRHSRSQR